MTTKQLTPKQETLAHFSVLADLRRRKEAKPCYLYILEAEGAGFCKVGISANPEKRVRDIQGSNPFKVNVAFKVPLRGFDDNRKAAEELEAMCHRALRPFKSKYAREWFEMPWKAAEVIVGSVAVAVCRANGVEPCKA